MFGWVVCICMFIAGLFSGDALYFVAGSIIYLALKLTDDNNDWY